MTQSKRYCRSEKFLIYDTLMHFIWYTLYDIPWYVDIKEIMEAKENFVEFWLAVCKTKGVFILIKKKFLEFLELFKGLYRDFAGNKYLDRFIHLSCKTTQKQKFSPDFFFSFFFFLFLLFSFDCCCCFFLFFFFVFFHLFMLLKELP